MSVILRVQTREGQARITVAPTDTLAALAAKVQEQMPGLVNFKLSRDPGHKDYLTPANATVAQLNLQHGDRIFAQHDPVAAAPAEAPSPARTHIVGQSLSGQQVVEMLEEESAARKPERPKNITLDEVDELLAKQDGREHLKSTVKRGFGDQSIDSMAVEPYDEKLLKEKDIKLMSFHAYLRKLNSVQGGGKFSELRRHDFGSYGAAGGKAGKAAGWGSKTVNMSSMPKAMTLNRQKYRHVDRVEIEDHTIFNSFLDAWRQTGAMRYGYLYGTYEQDPNVPLGIKAVVKAIYEPPQECALDGVNMLEDPNGETVDKVAEMLGLRKVGWIFIDLEVMEDDPSKYVHSRGKDTYFLRSNECVVAARLQNMHPSACKECDEGVYGSKFVTVVVTGNEKNELNYVAYQVSQQGMDLEAAEGILEWTSKADRCRVAMSSNDRYVPAIFYQDTSEFGNSITHTAEPYFPVDYLVVSVNGPTFPQQSNALFNTSFPIENRILAPQTDQAVLSIINHPDNKAFKPTGQLKLLSDFHLLSYLAVTHHSILGLTDTKEGLPALCRAVASRDSGAIAEVLQAAPWQNLCAVLASAG
eukprot:CAMPEP_0206241856 /NCGR_PEP_ID=MMETSP0047_2-20121206/16734_1 /ASSEMBLY_ACC=CAM_ASM_000192 /TAXON_ID=195065 /ORGANISM="Chroomonas mesostigmatica_cf, Strain CCMP1168" /LENGTH=584 /DNA_ID=CAMNT_0053666811 /DNA_START=112 /DNA_END=1863 /DNA_ORIENTATION=-